MVSALKTKVHLTMSEILGFAVLEKSVPEMPGLKD